jgi:hypothetical protein
MNDGESNLPENRLWQPTTAKWFAVVFGGSVLYAIVRYHLVVIKFCGLMGFSLAENDGSGPRGWATYRSSWSHRSRDPNL